MKRKLIVLLSLCILLSGCRLTPDPISPTEPIPTEPSTVQTETPGIPLLEQGSALEESSNLLYIPNEALESMVQPELRLLGNGLLLSEYKDQQLILKHISLEDGSLIAADSIPAGAEATLRIGSGEIGVCDRERGEITILDESFQTLRTYPVAAGGEAWYLNSELDTLYLFSSDRGVLALDLESGEERWLVDNASMVKCISRGSYWLVFEYTDRKDQKTYTRFLNPSTASMETMPLEDVSAVARLGDLWLLQKGEDHVLIREGTTGSASWEGSLRLLAPRHHLLGLDPSQRELTLFDTDGTFLSKCSLPQNSHAVTGPDFVWSGYWQGYFFIDFMGPDCRLMFWDVDAPTEGENLEITPLGSAPVPEPVLEPALYRRAEELSQRFGVDIRIGEQCNLEYSHYNFYHLTDPAFVRHGLDVLENALSRYPDGFFSQLCYGSVDSIRFELVGGLVRKDDDGSYPGAVAGFAQNVGSYYLVALEGFLFEEYTIYHELSHVIDKRLAWDALLREDALYSEDAWLALHPEGFSYAMSYTDYPKEFDRYLEAGYVVSGYSMSFPTEDRATLMESAMQGCTWIFEPGSKCREKLQFYSACIRDCFDTTGWPDTTAWEECLK